MLKIPNPIRPDIPYRAEARPRPLPTSPLAGRGRADLFQEPAITLRDAMLKLRADALERGMRDVAIVYGWSALRYAPDALERELAEIVRGLARSDNGEKHDFSREV